MLGWCVNTELSFGNTAFYTLLPKHKYLKLLGAHIRELRKSKGLSQRELAARIDKEEQTIQRIERGATNPTAFTLYQLAEGLEVEAGELMKIKTVSKK